MYQHPGSRPVNLDIRAFRFPLNAYLSILHRITGVLLVLVLSAGLIWFNCLILWPQDFALTVAWMDTWLGQLLLFSLCSALWFHWLAGLRHLLLEHDVWQMQSKPTRSKASAKVLLALFILGVAVYLLKVLYTVQGGI